MLQFLPSFILLTGNHLVPFEIATALIPRAPAVLMNHERANTISSHFRFLSADRLPPLKINDGMTSLTVGTFMTT